MSGRGKGTKKNVKSVSRSSRAGLQFPVGRVHRFLKKGIGQTISVAPININFLISRLLSSPRVAILINLVSKS